MAATLVETQQIVAGHMERIQREFKPGSKITVLVRFASLPERDFLMTDDDLDEVAQAVVRRKASEAAAKIGVSGQ